MIFAKDEIVFLLGAGASVDAKIPASRGMIQELEELLEQDGDWRPYSHLYNFVKSAIVYADGIKGRFDQSNFNIERLVNTLDELLRSDEHPLFPFIGSWTPKLAEVSGNDLTLLGQFRRKIVEQLSHHWVQLEYDEDAGYYKGLSAFQKEYQHPLRVFTLNYDLCVEKACADSGVERGFGDTRVWDWRIFDNEDQITNSIFLYKLHGSIDWVRETSGNLTYKDSGIPPEELEIIFGTTYKLQYMDPFLFFAYEFRKRTLTSAKLIVCIGYGFADDHINGIISQALNGRPERRLLVVSPPDDKTADCTFVKNLLGVTTSDSIVFRNYAAKPFLNDELTVDFLSKLFPDETPPFEELGTSPGQ
jgi:hypothetical protein